SKKWSVKIEDKLLAKITPSFYKRFPECRLNLTAIKRTWEKISYYSQQIQKQKEAIDSSGKLNIHYFIKQNLKNYSAFPHSEQPRPSQYAHQLASKISECIAILDGVRPQLDYLTKMIWSIQRHLLTEREPEQYHSPYDEYHPIDKLIVKIILEVSAKHPQVSQKELELKVKESLHSLQDLPSFSSVDQMMGNISPLVKDEIAGILIENPTQSFSKLAHEAVNFFKKAKDLIQTEEWSAIEKKIHIWTLQGDMICRFIRLNSESPLLQLIQQKWKQHPSFLPHHTFISEVCQHYLKTYPKLAPYSGQLFTRVTILYKYAWYSLFGEPKE